MRKKNNASGYHNDVFLLLNFLKVLLGRKNGFYNFFISSHVQEEIRPKKRFEVTLHSIFKIRIAKTNAVSELIVFYIELWAGNNYLQHRHTPINPQKNFT